MVKFLNYSDVNRNAAGVAVRDPAGLLAAFLGLANAADRAGRGGILSGSAGFEPENWTDS